MQKKIGDEKIFVTFENNHTGHGVSTLDTWCRSRICPAVRVWLEKVVATGIDWTSFKKMTRPQDDQLGFLGIEGISLGQEVEISEIMRISNKDFHNFRQKHVVKSSQLDSDCWKSLSRYAVMISNEGGISTLEKVKEDRIGGEDSFFFSFRQAGKLKYSRSIIRLYFWIQRTILACLLMNAIERPFFIPL